MRRIILSSKSGVFSSLFLESLRGDKVPFKRFQADISDGSSLQCWMPGVNNIVILLLPREMVFFDVEFGVSVGSVRLSLSKPNFQKIIGGFGHEAAGKHLYSRGLDVLLCYHSDGSISTWKRSGNSLGYVLIRHCDLVESRYSTLSSKAVGDIWNKVSFEFLAAVTGPKSCTSSTAVDFTKRPWYPSNIHIIGMPMDGSLWKWDLRASSETPCLKSMQEGISGHVSSMAVTMWDQRICGKQSSCFVAIGTVEGTVEVYMLTKSRGKLYSLSKLKKMQLTNSSSPVLGVTWLGTSGKIVAYVSGREGVGADKSSIHRNIVKVIDVHRGTSKTIRNASEPGKICAIRSSSSGAYLLLWCKGIPSEIWTALMDGDEPVRVRQIELDFTSVEWLPHGYGIGHSSPQNLEDEEKHNVRKDSYETLEDLPEELLSFSLSDARLGVLLIKGRKIQDTRPVTPTWAPLVTGEFRVVSSAASRGFIYLGGADGTLARWDTSTGNVIAVESGCTMVQKIDVSEDDQNGVAKLALLSSSGTFAVLFADYDGKFTSSKVTWVSGYSKVGYVNDISWVEPPLQTRSKVLMLQLREGGVCMMDFSNYTNTDPTTNEDGSSMPCSMLLPETLRNLLCILIQNGMTSTDMRKAVGKEDNILSDLEDTLRAYLPSDCIHDITTGHSNKRDHESKLPSSPMVSHGEDMPQGSLAELLKSRAVLGDDSSPGSPLYPTNSRNSTDKAVYQLGYRVSSQGGGIGDVSETLKSIKGSVKDMAVAGKHKVKKTLGQKEASPQADVQYSSQIQSPVVSKKDLWNSDNRMPQSLHEAIKAAADIQALASFPVGPLEEAFMKSYENISSNHVSAFRMALCARIQWNSDEEEFWMDLHSHLSSLQTHSPALSEDDSNLPCSSIVWQPQKHINILTEVSQWHSIIPNTSTQNESETLVEKYMIELICLGDIETAVSIQLASTPNLSKRFYRDALCSLGMAYACACEKLQTPEDALATSLFVQAARVIAINAATGGDPLLSIPLLYSTSKYKEVIEILQENSMWLCSACLAAKKLSDKEMRKPLSSLADHMSRKQGLVWQALGILIGNQQYQESIDLMLHFQMYDRAQGLVNILQEFDIDVAEETQTLVDQHYVRFIRSNISACFDSHP